MKTFFRTERPLIFVLACLPAGTLPILFGIVPNIG
jgi:hypothetical protein